MMMMIIIIINITIITMEFSFAKLQFAGYTTGGPDVVCVTE